MESVQVEIFGQIYTIKGKDDAGYIKHLADFVDTKMKEVRQGTGTSDPHRVAILTALTISDELYRIREEHSALRQSAERRLQGLLDLTSQGEDRKARPQRAAEPSS